MNLNFSWLNNALDEAIAEIVQQLKEEEVTEEELEERIRELWEDALYSIVEEIDTYAYDRAFDKIIFELTRSKNR